MVVRGEPAVAAAVAESPPRQGLFDALTLFASAGLFMDQRLGPSPIPVALMAFEDARPTIVEQPPALVVQYIGDLAARPFRVEPALPAQPRHHHAHRGWFHAEDAEQLGQDAEFGRPSAIP